MPYAIQKNKRNDSGDLCPFAVVQTDDNKTVGCHGTQQSAADHMIALQSNVEESAKQYKSKPEAIAIFTPLSEAALNDQNEIEIKIIGEGRGSSGYYTKEVLERDVPKVFPAGTKMFWNHRRGTDRPEGDLEKLAAVFTENPTYRNGSHGFGMYTRAKVMEQYKSAVNELSPYIGVSIYANGTYEMGEINGRKEKIITSLEGLNGNQSVDFVTTPGAGGRIVTLFESIGNGTQAQPEPQENHKENTTMDDKDLTEVIERAADLENELQAAKATIKALQGQLLAHEAATVAREAVEGVDLPQAAKTKIIETAVSQATPTNEGNLNRQALLGATQDLVKAERQYIASILESTTGKVKNAGFSPRQQSEEIESEKIASVFESLGKTMGLTEQSASQAWEV